MGRFVFIEPLATAAWSSSFSWLRLPQDRLSTAWPPKGGTPNFDRCVVPTSRSG